MSHLYRSTIPLVILGLGLSCSSPTEMCACPPARSAVVVRGVVSEAGGAPIAGARLFFAGVPRTNNSPLLGQFSTMPEAQTNSEGAFQGVAYSAFSPGPLELRVGVVVQLRPSDTVRISVDAVSFRYERSALDTVRLNVQIP